MMTGNERWIFTEFDTESHIESIEKEINYRIHKKERHREYKQKNYIKDSIFCLFMILFLILIPLIAIELLL